MKAPLINSERVLVLAPTSADAELSRSVLAETGIACHVCVDLAELCGELNVGAGAVLLTEEALTGYPRCLVESRRRQPPWSDLPILLLSGAGADSFTAAQAMDWLGNVTVLERPVRITTLISALRTALRGRRRQYELHDRLQDLHDKEVRLAADVADLTRLQEISTRLVQVGDFQRLLDEIVQVAVSITQTDKGAMQLVDPDSGDLTIAAQAGHEPPFLNYFGRVAHSRLACGAAARAGERLIVEDIAASPIFQGTPELDVSLAAGVRAIQSTPLCNRDGRLVGVLSTHFGVPHRPTDHQLRLLDLLARQAADFIERTRNERELRRRAEEFRAHFSFMATGNAQLDIETGRLLLVNQAMRDFTGYSDAELLERTFLDITHPDDRAASETHFRKLASGELPSFTLEKRVVARDGTIRWASVSATVAQRDAAGTPVRAGAVVVDITDRKLADEALRNSEERYRSLFESIDDGFCILEVRFDATDKPLDYRFLEVNPAFEKQTGLVNAQGQWARALIPALEEYWFETYGKVAQTGEAVRFQHRAVPMQRWFDVYAFRIGPPENRHVALLFKDITAHKQSELAAQEADRRKDEFLAMLAHELRNPLAPILNALQILRLESHSRPVIQRVQEMMERQVNNMVRLVDELLEISRITRGEITLRKERLDLSTIIESAIETSKPVLDDCGHRLEVSVPPGSLALDADSVRLAQVFTNLLNNAAKYTDDGGCIRLTVQREDDTAIVSVQDTGIGIPSDMLDRIFEMFARVNRPDKQPGGGLGIGLSLVRNLVEMHGGRVAARSNGPGEGSEFIVHLPLAVAHDVQTPVPARPQSTGLGQRRILIVDDNEDAADSLAMLLNFLGADAHVVYNGPAALEALETYRPAVMLLDIGMPGMDGCEVARQIRRRPQFRDTKLIALTGWGQEEDRTRTHEAGFDHHLIKPPDVQALQSLLMS